MNEIGAGDTSTADGARSTRTAGGIVRCDACPVLCRIRPEREGACSRYANCDGRLTRIELGALTFREAENGGGLVEFAANRGDGTLLRAAPVSGTNEAAYPDHKPAPFIVAGEYDGFDTVTVVSEGMFVHCGAKVKIDGERRIGAERSIVRAEGVPVGHVTTSEDAAAMLSLGGDRHLARGSRREGITTGRVIARLGNGDPVDLAVDGGTELTVQAGAAPVIDGRRESRVRPADASTVVAMGAPHWIGAVDEVVVVDETTTAVLTGHPTGRRLDMRDSGLRVAGRRVGPGCYRRAEAGASAGRLGAFPDPKAVIRRWDPRRARPGTRVLITTASGDAAAYGVLDASLELNLGPPPAELAASLQWLREQADVARCNVLFVAGAGRSLRAGVGEKPVLLARSVQAGESRVTMGGAPVFVWPGAGLTIMVDVERMPRQAFQALDGRAVVAPIEFTLPRHLYAALGGHDGLVRPLDEVVVRHAASAHIEQWLRSGAPAIGSANSRNS